MKARAYLHKWKFFYVTWVFELGDGTASSYFDNEPIFIIYSDHISYFSLHFRKDKAYEKLERFCKKKYGNGWVK